MNELLNKLSSYNIFNYLLPGVLFAVIGDEITSYSLMQKELVIGAFVYYFYGLVISRIGSLVLEPILKSLGVIDFAPYKDFVSASKSDEKIELLSETNNMYRTLAALFIFLLLIKLFEISSNYFGITIDNYLIAFILLLVGLFLVSYKKQSNYIKQRIAKIINSENNQANDNGEHK